jgi:hypothetical protein
LSVSKIRQKGFESQFRVAEEPIEPLNIRAIAYMYMSKALSVLGPNQELLLRLPSYVGGIGTLLCVTAAAFHLLRSKTAIFLVVYLTAFSPKLIFFAKEFKPYSLEVFLHASLTLWALEGARRGGVSKWFWVACAASFPFCYNVAFLLPALIIALSPGPVGQLWSSCLNLLARMTTLHRVIVIAFLVGILLVVNEAVYMALGFEARETYWGNKYDVFPGDKRLLETLVWYAGKTWDLITAPGHLHGLTPTQLTSAQIAFFATYVLGVVHLFKNRNYPTLLILVGPLLTVGIANILGYWPYGDFRTNLFLFPGLILLAGIGFEKLATLSRSPIPAITGIVIIVAITFPSDIAFFKSKSKAYGAPAPQLTRVLDVINERLQAEDNYDRNIILTDWHSWQVMDYYLDTHPTGIKKYADVRQNATLVRGSVNSERLLQRQLARIQYIASNQEKDDILIRVWIVVTKLSRFSSIQDFPLVTENIVFQMDVDSRDEQYHPRLFELRITKSDKTQ